MDTCLNPFGTGQCLSTVETEAEITKIKVSIPLEQGNVFRHKWKYKTAQAVKSQSLWNRAMSFDENQNQTAFEEIKSQSLWNRAMSFDFETNLYFHSRKDVSIPLEQGNVFRQIREYRWYPSRRSQSLWNRAMSFDLSHTRNRNNDQIVSIPLEQGNVFRHNDKWKFKLAQASQSLWNRAMSFDCSGVLEPCVARLPRATSQLFLMFE